MKANFPSGYRTGEVLTRRAFWVTTSQLAALADRFDELDAPPERVIARWVRDDCIRGQKMLVLRPPVGVLYDSRSGEALDAEGMARRLEQAYRACVPCIATVYSAGPRWRRLHGTGWMPRQTNPAAISHELGVCDMLLALHDEDPDLVADWVPDAARRKGAERGEKQPDAVLVRDGKPYLALEYAGAYSAARIVSFAQHCSDLNIHHRIFGPCPKPSSNPC